MSSPLGLSFRPSKGTTTPSVKIGQYEVTENKAVVSLFGNAQFSPYPTTDNPETGSVTGIKKLADVHNDETSDISIQSVIDYCSNKPGMKLEYSHFAYLKNLGVYPNNRLIIARRFASGVGNDLTATPGQPLATLVSYYPEDQDFFSIKFNEVYDDADGGFEEVLNEIGAELLDGDNAGGGMLGKAAGGAFGLLPLPSILDKLKVRIGQSMGLNSPGGGHPYGNPNMIREARVRKVLKKGAAGAGLSADFTIKMEVEYEQKFINGVDPTLVYMDLIQNALTFGTSEAFFEYTSAFASGSSNLLANLISGNFKAIIQGITQFVLALKQAIQEVLSTTLNAIIAEYKKKQKESEEKKAREERGDPEPEQEPEFSAEIKQFQDLLADATSRLWRGGPGFVISKYKVRILGIINALTGSPSTPWHVTIGNPKKPMFSSGDLECTGVTLTLGKTLAFNDLPSSIKLTVDFKNARALGAQEIFNRLNTGKGRSYTRLRKSFLEQNEQEIKDTANEYDETNAKKSKEQVDKEIAVATSKNVSDPGQNKPAGQKVEDSQRNKETQAAISGFNTTTGLGGGAETDYTRLSDDYIVDPDGRGRDPNSGDPEPALFQVKAGDKSTVPNDPQINLSNQSTNNPATVTSGLAQQNTVVAPVTLQTPGGTPPTTTEVAGPPIPPTLVTGPPPPPTLPTSNITSTKGYTYEIRKKGPNKFVVVKDKAGTIIYTGGESFTATEDILIQEAKNGLNDYE